ncbi:MAG: FAD-dependent oxidoreductase [Erysipelotrichaceae bacterium]
MKKLLTLLMALFLVSLSACSKQPETVSGTFTGTSHGFHGEVSVTITIEDNKIIDTVVSGDKETYGVGQVAVSTLGERITAANGTDIDTIAGASITSGAIISAAKKAIEESGAELVPNKVENSCTEEDITSADVVVIGAGGAGLTAAAAASQNGLNVIVLEKLSMPGGNTMVSGGYPNYVPDDLSAEGQVEMSESAEEMLYTRYLEYPTDNEETKALQEVVKKQYEEFKKTSSSIFVSPELQALYTYIGGGEIGDLDLIMEFAKGGSDAFEWLASLPEFADKMQLSKGVFMNGTGNGGYWYWAGGISSKSDISYTAYDKFIAPTLSELEANGGRVVYNMTATELIMEEGRVSGVKATDLEGHEHIYNASRGVIIATGGFGANSDMVEKYGGVTITKTTDMKGTTGDGIIMAQAVGADVTGMEYVQLHMHGDPKTGLLSDVHGSTTNPIYVNKEGFRFVCENGTRAEISNATLQQTGGMMYSIFDSQNASDVIESEVGGQVYKADTLEELAEIAGIDAEQLVKTVEEYNAAVDAGTVDQLDPVKYIWGSRIDTAPYYCTPLSPTVHYTMGGLVIDGDTHVLDTEGNIIEGLYAAGEVTGGIHGNNRGAGQALADIVIFGYKAGQAVSE